MRLPRIVFVLGKGGVGRTTVSAALGLALAARGERVLVFEWTVADPIAPWFGLPPVGPQPAEVAPGLAVANYDLDEALRAYFVDHLRLRLFYRRIVHGRHVRSVPAARKGKVQNSCWTRTESSISFWTNQSAWTRTESCDPPEGTKSLLTLCSRHPTCTRLDRKSTRLNSSHLGISYAV